MRRPLGVLVMAAAVLATDRVPQYARDGTIIGTRPTPRPVARAASAFRLFASTNVLLDVNRVSCNVNNVGEQCVDPTNSPVTGAGFWPAGSPDQYIFNGGMQVAAILAGGWQFAFAGDTVGAFIFDSRGDQTAGVVLSGLWDSRRPADLAAWPSAAFVRDPGLFDVSLLGREAASEQDSWVRYWMSPLSHDHSYYSPDSVPRPMGLVVDQRTLAWNSPYANRDILYVIFRLINASARDPARYAGLAAAGYTAEDIAEIARLGGLFQDSLEAGFGVQVPDTGFTWTQLYVGMGQDPDVGASGQNYSTTVLPFATAFAYKADFREANWVYPPDIFSPPFAAAPGLAGTKFLFAANGPVRGGSAVRLFTNTTGGAPFPDRVGIAALWRMMSGSILAQDGTCNADFRPVPTGQGMCQLVTMAGDTRWYQSTGPYPDVRAGEAVVFAIAYVFAAPVASALTLTGTWPDYKPGIPGTGPRLAAGRDTVRRIERVAGWLDHRDADGDGDLEQAEVRAVPYSLLHKAQFAQAFFDNRFVLPRAPEAPRFAVLPGDGRATVVWERAATEVIGDPYFPLASDPLSPLYDPNFRQFDVEGYRIWRGRSLSSMEVVAQYDFRGTALTDHTGQIYGSGEQVRQCAPEFGVVADCRADFLHGQFRAVPLAGTVVQIPPGGRAVLEGGGVLVTRADTAVTGGASGRLELQDTGVPFAFVDSGLVNGTTYVYAVTAFDVNSVNTGPTTLESDLIGKTVTPRVASSSARSAAYTTAMYGGDGTRLDTVKLLTPIDPDDGTFSGPIPPANGGSVILPIPVEELLPEGEYVLRIDSVSPGFADRWATPLPRVYFSEVGGREWSRGSVEVRANYLSANPDATDVYEYTGGLVPLDTARSRRFSAALGPDARISARFTGHATRIGASSPGAARAAYQGYVAPASGWLAHSRWFDEGAAEPPNPTIDPFGSRAHTSGMLSAASLIYSPLPNRVPTYGGAASQAIPWRYRNFVYATVAAWYPADIVVRWGSGGTVTVRDSTHRVDLPFKRAVQPGYGFLNAAAIVAVGVTSGQLSDGSAGVTFDPAVVSFYSLRTLQPVCTAPSFTAPCVPLEETARLQPVDVTNDGVADGSGIAFLINGEPFYMLMTALPAAGTAWHLRAIGGGTMTADCSPALPASGYTDILPGAQPTTCRNYAYTPPAIRPAYAPGLRFAVRVVRQYRADTTNYADLSRVHTVPDPLYFSNATGVAPAIRFLNLPERAIVRVYSSSGILVALLTHNDPTLGGELVWDVRSRNGQYVASGLYFYHVETPDHHTKIGRLTVVQQAWP